MLNPTHPFSSSTGPPPDPVPPWDERLVRLTDAALAAASVRGRAVARAALAAAAAATAQAREYAQSW